MTVTTCKVPELLRFFVSFVKSNNWVTIEGPQVCIFLRLDRSESIDIRRLVLFNSNVLHMWGA